MTTQTEALKLALEALEVAKQHIWLGDKAGVEANIKAHQTIIFIREALAQPEQKPMHPQLKAMLEEYFDKCFAESSPQRTWVGLTDEEENEYNYLGPDMHWVIQEIEAKLKEKNT